MYFNFKLIKYDDIPWQCNAVNLKTKKNCASCWAAPLYHGALSSIFYHRVIIVRRDAVSSFLFCSQLFFFFFFAGAFYSKWLLSSHSTIKHLLMKYCWDGLPSGRFSISVEDLWGSVRVTLRFFIISPNKDLLTKLFSLARFIDFTFSFYNYWALEV